jgi:polar amino acid transport system substrate-binding protein
MLRKILLPLVCLLCVLSCSKNEALKLRTLDDAAHARFCVKQGTVFDLYLHQRFPEAKFVFFDNNPDAVLGLDKGQCDALLLDKSKAPGFLMANPALGVLEDSVTATEIGVGFNKGDTLLVRQFNEWLAAHRAEVDTRYESWGRYPDITPMPPVPDSGSAGVVRLGISGVDEPSAFMRDGKYVGHDVDMMARFAADNHYKLELQAYSFQGLIAAAAMDKVDAIASNISITPERAEKVLFSNAYFTDPVTALARKENIVSGP